MSAVGITPDGQAGDIDRLSEVIRTVMAPMFESMIAGAVQRIDQHLDTRLDEIEGRLEAIKPTDGPKGGRQ